MSQTAAPTEEGDEIVITSQKERGAIVGSTQPEVRLNAGDVRALGVSTVTDLLNEIAAQTGSASGSAPITLLNGRRISSQAEISDLPSEAIERVEIFPPEVALRYGFRADQKVVNIVLRERFRAATGEAQLSAPTRGGKSTLRLSAGLLKIGKTGRGALDAQYNRETALFENERDIEVESRSAPDARPFRTLTAANEQASINATVNQFVFGDVSATGNARLEARSTRSGFGVDSVARPLERLNEQLTGHLGGALNGVIASWVWSALANADLSDDRSLTDRRIGDSILTATFNRTVDMQLIANGPVLTLPAGQLFANFKTGVESSLLSSDTQQAGFAQSLSLSRDQASAQASFDVPLTSRRRGPLRGVGNLSLNFNGALSQVSDFGTLKTYGYGLGWEPIRALNFTASANFEERAPSIQQLGNPVIISPAVPVFDFVTGQTVDIARAQGGNSDLRAANVRLLKVGVAWRPLAQDDFSIVANYSNTRTRNAIAAFPAATIDIQAAFPERFVRDAAGQLIAVDSRPVNFSQARAEQIRWGINFSKRLGPAPDPAQIERFRAEREARQAAETTGTRPERSNGGGFGGRATRVQFAFYHTWRLRDDIVIRDGAARLDLLEGATINNNGGQSAHEIEAQAGLTKNGFGVRLNGKWQSGTTVRSRGRDLTFTDRNLINLRLFADLGAQREWSAKNPWGRGMRITLSVDNVLNDKIQVRDLNGQTPLNFQSDYLDPQGRVVRLTVRKLFF